MNLLIKNGRVIDPETKFDAISDILIENGIITSINPSIKLAANPQLKIIDVKDKLVIPGVIDLHVHLRDFEQSYKETVETGTKAALRSGVTTVFAMPNTKPQLDCAKNIKKYQEIIKNNSSIDAFVVGAITKNLKGAELADLDSYPNLGIKLISDDGCDINDEKLLEEAYKKAKELNLLIVTHPEMNLIAPDGIINEGKISQKLGVPGQPNEKEWKAVERGIRLAKKTGSRAHFTHLSSKESIELIRQAKKETDLITCDITPHHFSFTEAIVEKLGGRAKVNPPLRTEKDRIALIEGIKDGTVDAIITDHAPHSMEEKNADLLKAAYGFTGLEILIPATITEFYHNQKIDLMRVIELMTINPAKLANLNSGRLQIGKPANITIIDLESAKKVDTSKFFSKAKCTPFQGMMLKGWPIMTVYRGEIFS